MCPLYCKYSRTCTKRPLKKKTEIYFQDRLSLNAGQKYCRMLRESILQYFRPSLEYHLSLRPMFCLLLSGLLSLNAGQKYCRILRKSILQYYRPTLGYHLSLRTLFDLLLSGRLRQVLLYTSLKCWLVSLVLDAMHRRDQLSLVK